LLFLRSKKGTATRVVRSKNPVRSVKRFKGTSFS
jgi:hypothetical protein